MAEILGSSELRIEGLTGAQETALAALRAGGTFVKAAEEAGVNRTTVYRWVHGDPHFRAAYNAWQQEAAESARARLVKLADMAVDVVEKALRRGDEKVALKVLRGIGSLRKKRRGSTSAEVLDLQMELRDKRELRRAETGMVQHFLKKMGMPAGERKHILSSRRGASEFREEVLQELERRGGEEQEGGNIESTKIAEEPTAAPVGFGEGDATSREPGTEATVVKIGGMGCDNPLSAREMHLASGGREAVEGDASSDATPQAMLHESVA